MFRTPFPPAAAALLLAASGCSGVAQDVPTPAAASHDIGYFEDLMHGRAVITHSEATLVGYIMLPDEGPEQNTPKNLCFSTGRLADSGRLLRQNYIDPADRAVISGWMPVYEPETGTLRLYTHNDIVFEGWVQDGWPRVLADACPEVELPPGMEVNEAQTGRTLAALRRQDPAAPIRGFVSDAPVYTVRTAEYLASLPAHDGEIFVSREYTDDGHSVVFPRFSTVWHLTGHPPWILDTAKRGGWLFPYSTGFAEVDDAERTYRERWTRVNGSASGTDEWGFDEWIGFLPTGVRHPLADWMDRMSAPDAPAIPLPRQSAPWGDLQVTFRSDLSAMIVRPEGRRSEGRWRLEGIHIVVEDADGEVGRWLARSFGARLKAANLLP